MRSGLNFLAVIIMSFAFASCEPIRGTFVANKDLSFNHKTIFGNKKKIKVRAGEREVKITKTDKYLKVDIDGAKKKIKFKSRGKDLPKNGNFSLSTRESGQPYDISVDIQTDYSRSDIVNTTESCYETCYETVCHRVCRQEPDGRGGYRTVCRRECYQESRQIHGYQDVSYYFSHEDTTASGSLFDAGEEVGSLNGTARDSDKHYTYRSHCDTRGQWCRGRRGSW